MDKKQFVEELFKTTEILKPFIEAYDKGAMKWDGTAYVKAETTKKTDPYALLWWSKLNTISNLLEAQEVDITKKQQKYINGVLFGGMGSFSDFSLDTEIWGKLAEDANQLLSQKRQKLFENLQSMV